jgi:hypothetical protein
MNRWLTFEFSWSIFMFVSLGILWPYTIFSNSHI